MNTDLAVYGFRLGASHGIGRQELLQLWAAACGSPAVAVSRVESSSGFGERGHTYRLWGSAKMRAPAVERRIRDALGKALPNATIVLVKLWLSDRGEKGAQRSGRREE